ncbi:MAG TPA: hypothetical protein VKZ18_12105 [Polyangia bacterium]|nr:hypothetical protein [Polyangia bacterium]
MTARTGAIKNAVGARAGTPERAELLYPGPKSLLMALMALPPMVVGLSAPTALELTSGVVAGLWFALLPVALYRRWATAALPFVAGGLLMFAVFALPFNSPAFMVNYWSAAVMLILALPKRNRQIVFDLPR